MNCREFDEIFLDVVCGRPLGPGVLEEALTHAGKCGRCAGQVAEHRRLSAELRALGESWGAAGAPPHIETRVREAFRREQLSAAESRPGYLRRRPIWSIAAAAIIAAMLAGWRIVAPPSPPKQGPAMASRMTPSASTSAVEGVHHQPAGAVRNTRRRTVRRPRPTPVAADTREIATKFFLLPHGESLPTVEVAPVVRVRLPRKVLLSFGLPINEDRAAEPVLADVVMGPEGTARAVRFVWTTAGDH